MISIALLALRGSLPFVKNALSALHADERAQDAFEYLLVIGGVSVLIVGLMISPVGDTIVEGVIHGVCFAIQGIGGDTGSDGPFAGLDCVEEG